MNVQKNFFTWHELTATNTGLPNNPTSPVHLAHLARLWDYLNSLREKLGAPIFVNSAFRTPDVNRKVGGSEGSFHMLGLAADIRTLPERMDSLRGLLAYHYEHEMHRHPQILSELIDHGSYLHIAL